jgi:protein-tyrosine phosphatase
VFHKRGGRIAGSARLVLGPLIAGQHLSLLIYRRRSHPWDEVAPGVWVGRRLNNAEAAEAVRQGVTAVLDLSVEMSEAAPFLALTYRHVPVLDLTAPTPEHLREAVAFIRAHAATGIVYVHCKVGYSRSATVAGAYLLASGRAATVEEALDLLRKARPGIIVRPEAKKALRAFERNTAGCAAPAALEPLPRRS